MASDEQFGSDWLTTKYIKELYIDIHLPMYKQLHSQLS